MNRSRTIMVCAAITLAFTVFASASLRRAMEHEPAIRLVENVQAFDAFPIPGIYTADEVVDNEEVTSIEGELHPIYRTTTNLRLRTEPSPEAEIIETIPQGTLLLVTGQPDEDWYSVYIGNNHGYMAAEFLDFVTFRPAGAPMYIAGSVTIMDADTGEVLYEDEQHTLRYPASITKIMTALLVLERVEDLSELVTFSRIAVDLPSYAGHIGMQAGDSMTVLDALNALMIVSANEVARALAEHVSGSVEAFAKEMNHKAASLGAVNTKFINPCGLPGKDQHTTSYDMALIMREAIRHPVFTQIIATTRADLPPVESRDSYRPMRNTNRMIHEDDPAFNKFVIGGKTGFTNDAQHTLVTYSDMDGRPVIISVLYVTQRGAIFTDTSALLEYMISR